MNIAQIESNVQSIFENFNKESFIYDFLLAFGTPKATIKKLQIGSLNLSKVEGEISWKKKLFFKEVLHQDLHVFIDEIKKDEVILKREPRFIIITDFTTLLAWDKKTNDSLDIPFIEIPKHFSFFLPLAGMEKAQNIFENPADAFSCISRIPKALVLLLFPVCLYSTCTKFGIFISLIFLQYDLFAL
jgi:hypothetical protein